MSRIDNMQPGFHSQRNFNGWHGSPSSHLADPIWRQALKSPAKYYAFFSFSFILLVGALVSTGMLDFTKLSRMKIHMNPNQITEKPRNRMEISLNCTSMNLTQACPATYPTSLSPEDDPDNPSAPTCPEYFRWIHEDLRPWARTGITRDMVERARKTANFRLVILNGRAYVATRDKSFQSRDTFTLWGILQLLRRYPGKVPDLELFFDCVDWPVILSSDHSAPDALPPPPLFRYCGNDETLDIVFPDWTFWGWPEIHIKPWGPLLKDLEKGNRRTKWTDREPHAYWKGNPDVAETRKDLLRCNVSEGKDWNVRAYRQNWTKETEEGYKQSDLASQCVHRFKIYIEGSAWSVSEKYILACDSISLIVQPHYYDFFTRGLMPLQHYWPVRENDKCRSIKFAVDWGNSHQEEAQAIGRAASKFIQDELKLDYVYDYMFHLLNEYSKLLTFKPEIPPNATEYCAETMACPAEGVAKQFMMESLVTSPSETSPCILPPPHNPSSLLDILRRKENASIQVESLQKYYWENQTAPPS